ncbi:MAG: DUF1818 family protein [Microcoleaceae cyanobacterium]
MERIVKSGLGWRIGWDAQADEFMGLVGAEQWAIELTEAEFNDFCQLLTQLAETMEQMSDELMDEEKITCETETDLLWMQVEGYPHSYSLQLILNTGRRGEGYWSASAVGELIKAAKILKVF